MSAQMSHSFLIDNNKELLVLGLRSQSTCELAYGTFLRIPELERSLWAFTREQRAPSSLPWPAGHPQSSLVLSTDGSNTPSTVIHQVACRGVSWLGHFPYTVNSAATPNALKYSGLAPRKTLPCYFNHSFLFSLVFLQGLPVQTLLSRPVSDLAVAPLRHHWGLLAGDGTCSSSTDVTLSWAIIIASQLPTYHYIQKCPVSAGTLWVQSGYKEHPAVVPKPRECSKRAWAWVRSALLQADVALGTRANFLTSLADSGCFNTLCLCPFSLILSLLSGNSCLLVLLVSWLADHVGVFEIRGISSYTPTEACSHWPPSAFSV